MGSKGFSTIGSESSHARCPIDMEKPVPDDSVKKEISVLDAVLPVSFCQIMIAVLERSVLTWDW